MFGYSLISVIFVFLQISPPSQLSRGLHDLTQRSSNGHLKKEQKTIKRSQENGNQKKGAQISSAYSFSILAIFHLQPPFAEVLSGMLRAA